MPDEKKQKDLFDDDEQPAPGGAKQTPPPPLRPQIVVTPQVLEVLFNYKKNILDQQEERINGLLSSAHKGQSDLIAAFKATIKKDLEEYHIEKEYQTKREFRNTTIIFGLFTFAMMLGALFLFSFYYESTDNFKALKSFNASWSKVQQEKAAEIKSLQEAADKKASDKKPVDKKK